MNNMDIRLLFCCGSTPIKAGIVRNDDEGSSTIFAVFNRKDVEEEMGEPAKTGDTEFAVALTGLHRDYNGPGRYFANDPTIKVFGKKVLITQYRGIDI